jgi:DeoR/GlpR family transcriptional regulator of sugar metabolism
MSVSVGRVEQIDTLYTDVAPPDAFAALLAGADVQVVTCGDA